MDTLAILKYGSFSIALGFICILSYYAYHDPNASTYKTAAYVLSMFIALVIGLVFYIRYSSTERMALIKNSIGLLFFGIVILVITFFSFSSPITNSDTPDYWYYLESVILLLIIITFFAIIYNMFRDYLQNLDGWTGILFNLLFY
jgi:hypothetical protein